MQKGLYMSQEPQSFGSLIRDAVFALENGDRKTAQMNLQQALKLDPENEEAWLWAAKAADNVGERIYCYNQVLKYNPYNEVAYENLNVLQSSASPNLTYAENDAPSSLPLGYEPNSLYGTAPDTYENDPMSQFILQRLKERIGVPEIVRELCAEYGMGWSDAKERVDQVWLKHGASIQRQTNWYVIGLAILGVILGLMLIILPIVNFPATTVRSSGRIIFLGVFFLAVSVGSLIEIWLRNERQRKIANFDKHSKTKI